MFGRKKQKKIEKVSENIRVIPEDFYGAKDPVIHYKKTQVTKKMKLKSNSAHKIKSVVGLSKLSGLLKNKVFLYSVIGVAFLIVIGLITWYYLDQSGLIGIKTVSIEQTEKIDITNKKDKEVYPPINQPLPDIEEKVATTTEEMVEEVEEVVLSLEEQSIDYPRIILADGADLDSDSLTDMEEEIFNTDSGTWDTDNDGYYDGQEVINLYNPKGLAPVKLIDSGLVQEYVNPIWQYRVYYPVDWERGVVDDQSKQVLFSSITGDFVEVSVYQMQIGEDFVDWFARKATGQKFDDIIEFSNRFKEDGYKRRDNLSAYFVQDENVYVLIYHPGITGFVSFRNIMKMMVNSFRPSRTLVEIPDQVKLPLAPTTSDDIIDNGEFSTSTEEGLSSIF